MSAASASVLPFSALEKPRNSRLVITPELPRAPRSMAEAALLLTSATVQVSAIFSSSVRAAPMVMLMLVPVSPSGTGKTFSSSTRVRWLEMLLAPEIIASRRILPVIMYYTSIIGLLTDRAASVGGDIVHIHIHAGHLQAGGMLDFIAHAVGDALGDGGDVQAIAHCNVQRDLQRAVFLLDCNALLGQAAVAQRRAHRAGRRVLAHGRNAVAVAGRLGDQTGKIFICQRDAPAGVHLGDHRRTSLRFGAGAMLQPPRP